jgi:hypothetical protein
MVYFGDWQLLTIEQQEFLIAHYIGQGLLEAHQDDAAQRAAKRQSAKKGST